MDRGFFRQWGLDLDDAGFAQALAALGTSMGLPSPNVPDAGADPIEFRPSQLSDLISSDWQYYKSVLGSAEVFRDAWKKNAQRSVRIEIGEPPFVEPRAGYDPWWLIEQLSHPAVGARSVYLRKDKPEHPVSWHWPLRIGLLPGERSDALRESIGHGTLRALVEFVDIGLIETDCDLLLLPVNLRTALQKVLALQCRIAADCVLVLGGMSVNPSHAQALIDAMRAEVYTSGVALLSVPKESRGVMEKGESWLRLLVTHLSHNEPLDVALFSIKKELNLQPPYFSASRALIEVAHLEVSAARYAMKLHEIPPTGTIYIEPVVAGSLRLPPTAPPHHLADVFLRNLPYYDWHYESGDATSFVRLRSNVEKQLGKHIRLGSTMARPPMREQTAAIVREIAPPQPRHLQAHIYDANNVPVENALAPSTSYEVLVKIAIPAAGWDVFPQPFRSDLLPPSADGHKLSVVFCELCTSTDIAHPPQRAEIHLPATGDSTVCEFFFRTGEEQKEFRSRLLVLFQGRVLQTAILRRAVGEATLVNHPAGLEPETVVRSSFERLVPAQKFDAAIVLNHTAADTPGVTVITSEAEAPGIATFEEQPGLRPLLDIFNRILTQLTSLATPPSRIDDPDMISALRQLANQGRSVWRLFLQRCAPLANARRIQVVEAVPGTFLPVEFFYDGVAPLAMSTLCSGALNELADPKNACTSRDNNKVTCPTEFWSFSRVIERHSHRRVNNNGDIYEISEPSMERPKVDVLSRAVVATSDRVATADRDKLLAVARAVCGSAVDATDVEDLQRKISETSPTLLILLPHSLQDPHNIGMAALEIGGEIINSAQLDRQHVLGPESTTGPLVLLLGCSTELTQLPYQTFVESFKMSGASIVLATMSTIRGRHAVTFADSLLHEIKSCVDAGNCAFGDALLSTRRKLLAQGNPLVLTLTAYGDSEWLL